jgi:hypothetical protein
MKEADKNLYTSKANGRNRITLTHSLAGTRLNGRPEVEYAPAQPSH